jgi:hypothetical protein
MFYSRDITAIHPYCGGWDPLDHRIDRNFVLPYYDYSNASLLTWLKEGIKNWSVHVRSVQHSLSFQKMLAIRRENGQSASLMYNVGPRRPAVVILLRWKNQNCLLKTCALGSECSATSPIGFLLHL